VQRIGLSADRFVDHGSVSDLRRTLRLDVDGIAEQVREQITALRLAPATVAQRRKRSA
jgi:hypothetical protein